MGNGIHKGKWYQQSIKYIDLNIGNVQHEEKW